MLIPTWVLLLVWTFAAWLTVTGNLVNDVVQPALAGGLVLIVLLIGFTVMQHAFAGGVVMQGPIGDTERKALALTGAGDIVWDWDVARDRIYTGPEAEDLLGLQRGDAGGAGARLAGDTPSRPTATASRRRSTRPSNCAAGGSPRISACAREDGHYRWFHLRARPVLGSDGEVLRCVGTLLDVTEERNAEERLLHDAVHDNLTGLPNRELFLDRLRAAITRDQRRGRGAAVGVHARHRPLQAGQRRLRRRGRRLDPADHRPPAGPPAQAAGHAGAARPATSSPSCSSRRASRSASPPSPNPCAGRCARRSRSARRKSS